MIPVSQTTDPEVRQLADEAEAFLTSHAWCGEVSDRHLAFAIPGVLGVFQFSFTPTEPDVDDCLWVIVGDVPSAYLVLDNAATWQEALDVYVLEMSKWVDGVRTGSDLEDIIPVNASPTTEYADMLDSRLRFIRRELIAAASDSVEGDI